MKIKEVLEVKVKKVLENAVIPEYQTEGAACFDLVAASKSFEPLLVGPTYVYDTGLAFEIPEGFVGLVFPRSSITTKTTLSLGNAVGVIDSDYRGTIKFQFRKTNPMYQQDYNVGDRIGQMMILPVPSVKLELAEELTETNRGDGSFGSTGK
jgi:dUTP pyrophosphatase